jgi:hypothetical protein
MWWVPLVSDPKLVLTKLEDPVWGGGGVGIVGILYILVTPRENKTETKLNNKQYGSEGIQNRTTM